MKDNSNNLENKGIQDGGEIMPEQNQLRSIHEENHLQQIKQEQANDASVDDKNMEQLILKENTAE